MTGFRDKVHFLQAELDRLRTERQDYYLGARHAEHEADELPSIIADFDQKIDAIIVEIVKLSGQVR